MASEEITPEMLDEEEIERLPNMDIPHIRFLYSVEVEPKKGELKKELLSLAEKDSMAPFYESLTQEFHWQVDSKLLEKMKAANSEILKAIEEKHTDAVENLGDVEVLNALYAKAKHYSRIGEKDKALQALSEASAKPQSANQKITAVLHMIRIGLFHNDVQLVKENIEKARILVEEGGDWDRRNRLKVYEASYFMITRDIKGASKLLLECIATFSCTELYSFNRFIFYTVVISLLTLDRVTLKKKVVDAPEILGVIDDIPHLNKFLRSLYNCDYRGFFEALVELHDVIAKDEYLAAHKRYIIREFRVLAYAQFLESYRSVTTQSMASAFGVSIPFLDKELSRFIAAGRLNAKIDKVQGVIETNRPDAKNAQYQDVIKQGDLLLNRIQKLARAINV